MLLNSKRFGLLIEDIVKTKKISYMDAVLHYCENNNLDTGSINTLINKSLKEKLKLEAENLNLIQKSDTGKLPIWTVMKLTNYILQLTP